MLLVAVLVVELEVVELEVVQLVFEAVVEVMVE